jgi:ABC-type glycerol-3-phosphate transport system substrate-binding protein
VKKLANGMDVRYLRSALRVVSGIVLATAVFTFQLAAFAQTSPPKELAAIPPNKDTDLKFYHADGTIQMGVEALEHMTSDADLVLWVAGNQFFAMDEVVGAFQKTHPGVTVGLITLPPGLILSAIQGGGWVYNGNNRQSWTPAAAQGCGRHEQIRHLHAQRVADHGCEGQPENNNRDR